MKKIHFEVIRHPLLSIDLQEAIDYYNDKKAYLGNEFYHIAVKQLKALKKDALLYQIRYEDVRCLQIRRFPFMIHYTVDSEQNKVYAHGI
ncbi:MAG: hypothetical protein HYU67_08705 [Flavobacteriia bacterium]|nr:hypothetical protein [Flavobacteriia bacterium]